MTAITQYLKGLGYSVVDDSYYAMIARMYDWYRGKVKDFHGYTQYNGKRKLHRERASLGMAKSVAEDWASLCLNEKAEIVIDDDEINTAVTAVLDANDFRVRANQLLELAFALGTGAFVEYLDEERVVIDYIPASMIYPLAWEDGRITECAFASEREEHGQKLVYLNIHRREGAQYVVDNRLFTRSGDVLTPAPLPDDIAIRFDTGADVPLFQIIRPNIVNNAAAGCPLGLSVYANAIDVLKGIDLIFDSYCGEFRLGKKRIIVPTTMAQRIQEADGSVQTLFDDNDVEFYALGLGETAEPKLTEINMELRSEAHEQALKTALNLLSVKCGLGNDRYSFDQNGLKTATEVISERSELYQHLRKHELVIESALVDLCRAVASLSGLRTNFEISVNFDDSIIEDIDKEKQTFLQEIRDGVRQKYEYRMRFFGEDETTAKALTTAESNTTDLFGGF